MQQTLVHALKSTAHWFAETLINLGDIVKVEFMQHTQSLVLLQASH
jgi:hypothetical protein